jgi:hypothetical protein
MCNSQFIISVGLSAKVVAITLKKDRDICSEILVSDNDNNTEPTWNLVYEI